ncbi:hypothetical protein AGMMS49975_02990 [Clostridia bacterium]|nr:hypothetical protein AGMMS49975_02990 [Clostridia bacterium]
MTDHVYDAIIYTAYDKAKTLAEKHFSPEDSESFLAEWRKWYTSVTGKEIRGDYYAKTRICNGYIRTQ